jgi:hypothetical protein
MLSEVCQHIKNHCSYGSNPQRQGQVPVKPGRNHGSTRAGQEVGQHGSYEPRSIVVSAQRANPGT